MPLALTDALIQSSAAQALGVDPRVLKSDKNAVACFEATARVHRNAGGGADGEKETRKA
jgi:hypothetical protein